MCNGNCRYRIHFLKIDNICIRSTGVEFYFEELSLLRQMMTETVFVEYDCGIFFKVRGARDVTA